MKKLTVTLALVILASMLTATSALADSAPGYNNGGGGGDLPMTGVDLATYIAAGLAIIVLGFALQVLARRHEARRTS